MKLLIDIWNFPLTVGFVAVWCATSHMVATIGLLWKKRKDRQEAMALVQTLGDDIEALRKRMEERRIQQQEAYLRNKGAFPAMESDTCL